MEEMHSAYSGGTRTDDMPVEEVLSQAAGSVVKGIDEMKNLQAGFVSASRGIVSAVDRMVARMDTFVSPSPDGTTGNGVVHPSGVTGGAFDLSGAPSGDSRRLDALIDALARSQSLEFNESSGRYEKRRTGAPGAATGPEGRDEEIGRLGDMLRNSPLDFLNREMLEKALESRMLWSPVGGDAAFDEEAWAKAFTSENGKSMPESVADAIAKLSLDEIKKKFEDVQSMADEQAKQADATADRMLSLLRASERQLDAIDRAEEERRRKSAEERMTSHFESGIVSPVEYLDRDTLAAMIEHRQAWEQEFPDDTGVRWAQEYEKNLKGKIGSQAALGMGNVSLQSMRNRLDWHDRTAEGNEALYSGFESARRSAVEGLLQEERDREQSERLRSEATDAARRARVADATQIETWESSTGTSFANMVIDSENARRGLSGADAYTLANRDIIPEEAKVLDLLMSASSTYRKIMERWETRYDKETEAYAKSIRRRAEAEQLSEERVQELIDAYQEDREKRKGGEAVQEGRAAARELGYAGGSGAVGFGNLDWDNIDRDNANIKTRRQLREFADDAIQRLGGGRRQQNIGEKVEDLASGVQGGVDFLRGLGDTAEGAGTLSQLGAKLGEGSKVGGMLTKAGAALGEGGKLAGALGAVGGAAGAVGEAFSGPLGWALLGGQVLGQLVTSATNFAGDQAQYAASLTGESDMFKGMGMNAQNAFENKIAEAFSNVSGAEMDRMREALTSARVSYGSEEWGRGLEFGKSAKSKYGISTQTATQMYTEAVVKAGLSMSELDGIMGNLQQTVKQTGRSMEDAVKQFTSTVSSIERGTGVTSAAAMSTASDLQSLDASGVSGEAMANVAGYFQEGDPILAQEITRIMDANEDMEYGTARVMAAQSLMGTSYGAAILSSKDPKLGYVMSYPIEGFDKSLSEMINSSDVSELAQALEVVREGKTRAVAGYGPGLGSGPGGTAIAAIARYAEELSPSWKGRVDSRDSTTIASALKNEVDAYEKFQSGESIDGPTFAEGGMEEMGWIFDTNNGNQYGQYGKSYQDIGVKSAGGEDLGMTNKEAVDAIMNREASSEVLQAVDSKTQDRTIGAQVLDAGIMTMEQAKNLTENDLSRIASSAKSEWTNSGTDMGFMDWISSEEGKASIGDSISGITDKAIEEDRKEQTVKADIGVEFRGDAKKVLRQYNIEEERNERRENAGQDVNW